MSVALPGVPAYPAALSAPFPWFGGKRRVADRVWEALGDPGGYVEPFAGSAAVLLARRLRGRRVETINDADGWLVNVWRAIQLAPDATAAFARGPVTEIDYHARLAWLQERRNADLVAWLEGDPEHCDAKAAGWWLYVTACGIGDPFGGGPWCVVDGYLRDSRELPHLGNAGQGVNRELPHLGDAGQGALGDYMRALAARLSRVRITCGDWTRVLTPSVARASAGSSVTGVFLDPPYATSGDLYAEHRPGIATDVRDWCAAAPPAYRIVLCGYDTDHDALLPLGWRKEAGRAGGGSGYSTNPRAGRRERLWLSPACLGDDLLSLLGENVI